MTPYTTKYARIFIAEHCVGLFLYKFRFFYLIASLTLNPLFDDIYFKINLFIS